MGVRSRSLIVPSLVALIGAFLIGWDGLLTQAFTDYEVEAEPSFNALRAGDLGGFLAHLPAYGGSLILRSPFVLASQLFGGGALSAFRAAAVPCLLAGVVLGVFLFSKIRGRGAWLALALAAFNPITLRALEIGHPEELFGAVLCVGAMFCALNDRVTWAGLLLGLALANKPWAVLAVGPVLLALDHGRIRALAFAGATAAIIVAPLLLHGDSSFGAQSLGAATNKTAIFQPNQLWWFLGSHGTPVFGTYGELPDYRSPPAFVNTIAHPLIAVMVIPLSIVFWRLKPRRADALGLLTLLLAMRSLLDPWDSVYYVLPFLIALLAWEVHAHRRAPWFAAIATVTAWTAFEIVPRYVSPDLQSGAYLLWILPTVILIATRVFVPVRFAMLKGITGARLHRYMPTLSGPAAPRSL